MYYCQDMFYILVDPESHTPVGILLTHLNFQASYNLVRGHIGRVIFLNFQFGIQQITQLILYHKAVFVGDDFGHL